MADTNGAIYGIVSEEGNIKVGNEVVLMDHATLSIIAKTTTDQYGGYMFNNLDPAKTDYMLFTVDNDGVTPKNALIKDYVQPVTSNNGTTEGNFCGALESLAPVSSGIPMYRRGTTVNTMRVHRMHGNSVHAGRTTDWGGVAGWTDSAENPATPAFACPIPNAPLIRGMKHTAGWSGWRGRATDWTTCSADRPKSQIMPAINLPEGQGHFSVLATHYTDPAGPMTYSVCYELMPTQDDVRRRAGHCRNLFYPDDPTYYTTDSFFNICFEANHELRLKWLTNNGGNTPSAGNKRNVLVTTLTENKWYSVVVRIAEPTDPIKVDVIDNYAGTKQTFTLADTLGSINTQLLYGSTNDTYGVPVRNGFRISGPHNQAVNNTWNTWNSGTCWTWLAFTTGNGYSGPWARWNRQLSDADVELLFAGITDSAVALMPRGLAEIYKHAPQTYIPFDEFPGVVPYQTRVGQAVGMYPIQSASKTELDVFSLRRRKAILYGQGVRLYHTHIPEASCFTVAAFINQPVLNGAGGVYNVVFAESDYDADSLNTNYFHLIHLSIEAGGRPRAYWRNSAKGYNDKYMGVTDTPLKNVGQHMVVWVFDIYNGLNIKAYIDGVLWGTTTVSQQYLDSLFTGIDSAYGLKSFASVGSGFPASILHMGVSGAGIVRSTIQTTDIAVYAGALAAGDITEIYDAWQLAIGPDSHV